MVDCQDEQAKSYSQINEEIKSYTLSFKLLVVKHAKMSSTGAAEGNSGLIEKRWDNGYKMRAKFKIKLVQKIEAVLEETRPRWKKD